MRAVYVQPIARERRGGVDRFAEKILSDTEIAFAPGDREVGVKKIDKNQGVMAPRDRT
jgi:hypothetical protein